MAEATKQDVERKRSPGYPVISLDEAIEKTRVLYEEDKGSAATSEVIAAHWNSKTNSSAFMQTLASLKRFGLLVDAGAAGWKVSPEAVDILLLPDGDAVREQRIKEAAIAPKVHLDLWNEYGTNLPSDANLRHKLVTTKGFQANSASDLIKQYKKTLAFAKLSEGDKLSDERKAIAPAVGDLVQWTSQGALQFPEPRRFTGVSDDGAWAFIEGSLTGVPLSEIHRVEVPDGKVKPMTPAVNSTTPPSAPPAAPGKIAPVAPGQKDFPLYLTNQQRAVLYVPAVMSAKDYVLLKQQIESHLLIIGATGVDPPVEPKTADQKN